MVLLAKVDFLNLTVNVIIKHNTCEKNHDIYCIDCLMKMRGRDDMIIVSRVEIQSYIRKGSRKNEEQIM